MSNSQWPPPGSQQNSPWASQDPNWRPPQFHDATGRDPRQPFGQPTNTPTPPQQLAPPPRSGPKMWWVVAAVALIAVVFVALQLSNQSSPGAAGSASASPAPRPSVTRTGNFIPFEGNGDGTFEIIGYQWAKDELTLNLKVEVAEGEHTFTLFAFTNETRASYDPIDPSPFTASAARPYTAEVTFAMPKGDASIILATASGNVALTALPVSG